MRVERSAEGFRLAGGGDDVALVNRFLVHLSVRNFAVGDPTGLRLRLVELHAVLR